MISEEELIENYISEADWKVRENANTSFSFSGIVSHIKDKAFSNYALNRIYSKEISDAHRKGFMHIHNLGNSITGYCAGWSLYNLVIMGFGGAGCVISRPPKHFDTFVGQITNFIGCVQLEWAGAQAFSSIDTLAAPFIRADGLDYKQVKQQVQQLIYSLNVPSRWACFSEDTDILTERGWESFRELKKGTKLMTLNTKTDMLEYKPMLDMHVYDFDDHIWCLKNRSQEQLLTPDHNVLRCRFNFKNTKYSLEKVQSISVKHLQIPLSSNWKGEDKFNEDLLKLIAWICTEGTIRNSPKDGRITIYQSLKHAKNIEEIERILSSLDIIYNKGRNKSGFGGADCCSIRLSRPVSRTLKSLFFKDGKKIPKCIMELSPRLLRMFIETWLKADGHIDRYSGERWILYTKLDEERDKLQELILKAGWGSTYSTNRNGVYIITIFRHNSTKITHRGLVKYKGKVWCPTTANHTVIVRRKGSVFISGNCQSPFSNLTLDWTADNSWKEKKAVVGGKETEIKYGDYQKEMDLFNKALMEVMSEGDGEGRPFTFPIITINMTEKFDWDSPNNEILWKVTGKYGSPYFMNYIGSGLDPNSIHAMCCRLHLDKNELVNRPGGMWSFGDGTGSLGVVAINLNRMGIISKNKEEFFGNVRKYMDLAKESLEKKRVVVQDMLDRNILPFTKRYLGHFKNHFNTIGLIGMNEACVNLLGKDITTPEGLAFSVETMKFMRRTIAEYQKETGHLYNLESTPGEGSSYSLALLDKQFHPDKYLSGSNGSVYLTNSTQIPSEKQTDIVEAIIHQSVLQPLYNGGTVMHLWVGEEITDTEVVKNMVRKMCEKTPLPYFTLSPTFSVCKAHGYISGKHFSCPTCGTETDVYSRIVGYYRPVRNWNKGKRNEFENRVHLYEDQLCKIREDGLNSVHKDLKDVQVSIKDYS